MSISDYNVRAELFAVEENEGSDGETIYAPVSVGHAWIRLRRRALSAYRVGQTEYADVADEVVEGETPYRSDVAEGMRIVAENAVYRVMSALDPNGKREILRLRLSTLHTAI